MFSMLGRTLQTMLKNPLVRSIIQVLGCGAMGPGLIGGCAGLTGALTLGAGGSLTAALESAAFAFASAAVFTGVGEMLGSSPDLFVKTLVHGVAGGALSVAQGGNFLQGFAANAVGALGGGLASGGELAGTYGDDIPAKQIARALISGAAGYAGASVTGGKCADAAVTAAFASLYNGDGVFHGHHSTPREVLGWLEDYASDALKDGRIRGAAGSPDIFEIDANAHMAAHRQGLYNEVFT